MYLSVPILTRTATSKSTSSSCRCTGVEDLHQAEAGRASTQGGGQNRMRYFIEAEEAHRLSLAFTDKSRNQRQEPNMGLSGSNLFSHGPKPGMVFGASMANLHYKNPADCSACPLRYDLHAGPTRY